MQLIKKYFPQLNDIQLKKLLHFEKLIKEWNKKINLISRKDVENFQINHLIHSLSISKLILGVIRERKCTQKETLFFEFFLEIFNFFFCTFR